MKEFLEICHDYYGKVLTFVRSLVHDKQAAQDITQDIFLKLWKNRGKLKGIKSPDDFLFILSKNACLDYFKKAYRRKEISAEMFDEFLISRLSYNPDSQINSASEIKRLRELANSLPPRQKDIFLMSCFNGLTNDEIASVLGISKKAVENQLSLAKKNVKNYS